MYKPMIAALIFLTLPFSTLQARTPNDNFFGDQWYLDRIGADGAWDVVTGDDDLIIAILDTGFDLDHPDLEANLWINEAEIPANNLDDDGDGFIDDVAGWDFVDDDAVPEPEEPATPESGAMTHGTLIAGLIAAETNNRIGYSGVLWEADIMPLRVLNENGVGDENTTAAAVDYAVANGAKVINMSFAGTATGYKLRTAVRRAYEAGVVVVAALGNDSENLDITPAYPACYQSEITDWVLGVSATGLNDEETDFTNYGASCADLSAPGVDIAGLNYVSPNAANEEAYGGPWNGTSMSSPLVAGAAGLLLAKYPTLTPAQVFTILKLSVDPITDTLSGAGSIGVGRLNIEQALNLAPAFVTTASAEVVKPGTTTPVSSVPTADGHYNDSAHYSFVALGAARGSLPSVQVYRADGLPYATFNAYASNFKGGVRVAAENLDDDATPEIITGAGQGGGPHVRIFKAYGALVSEFFAYDPASGQGVNIAVGDVDNDSVAEVVTAVGAGVSNDVIVWSQTGQEKARITVTGFANDAQLAVAIADVDNDWDKEIVVFSESGESRVAIYNLDGTRVVDFVAFPGETNGVRVDVADLDDDYRDEIVTAGGVGASSAIRIYNKIGAYWGGFTLPQTTGVMLTVSTADIDVNGQPDIVIAPQNAAGNVSVHSLTGDLLNHVGDGLVGDLGGYLAAW